MTISLICFLAIVVIHWHNSNGESVYSINIERRMELFENELFQTKAELMKTNQRLKETNIKNQELEMTVETFNSELEEVKVRLKIAESQLNGINKTWNKCDIEPRDMKSGDIKNIIFEHEIIKKPSLRLNLVNQNYVIVELPVTNITNNLNETVGISVNNKILKTRQTQIRISKAPRGETFCFATFLHCYWLNIHVYIVTMIIIG